MQEVRVHAQVWMENLIIYLCTLLLQSLCSCGRGSLPDTPHCAGWPRRPGSRRTRRRRARHTRRNQGGTANTPSAPRPGRNPRGSRARTGHRGGSGTPRSLQHATVGTDGWTVSERSELPASPSRGGKYSSALCFRKARRLRVRIQHACPERQESKAIVCVNEAHAGKKSSRIKLLLNNELTLNDPPLPHTRT